MSSSSSSCSKLPYHNGFECWCIWGSYAQVTFNFGSTRFIAFPLFHLLHIHCQNINFVQICVIVHVVKQPSINHFIFLKHSLLSIFAVNTNLQEKFSLVTISYFFGVVYLCFVSTQNFSSKCSKSSQLLKAFPSLCWP